MKSQPNAFSKSRLKLAFVDLLGTVIHHRTGRILALMDSFLRGLHNHNWEIYILTRFSCEQAEELLAPLQMQNQIRIVSSSGTTKGQVINQKIHNLGEGDYLYLDDKPENLASVRSECGDLVRVIGFVGSKKYTPRLSGWCSQNGVELALSVSDLCEGLHIGCVSDSELVQSKSKWTEEELFLLMPGLDHPMSAIAGETFYLDHRAVISELLNFRRINNFRNFWTNAAWITCNECLLKVMIESVIQSIGLTRNEVLGKSYKYNEYLTALNHFSKSHREFDFQFAFGQAFDCAKEGIRTIGILAERCRLSGRSIDPNRLEFAQSAIMKSIEQT